MTYPFELSRQTRKNILYFVQDLNEDSINFIPENSKNNIAWNLGHILVTQQLLMYKMAGVEMTIPVEWVDKYRKGSSPEAKIAFDEFNAIKEMYVSSIDKAESDYLEGKFKNYTPYKTSYGVTLNSIEDVIQFLYAHDALHWGIILGLKKLV